MKKVLLAATMLFSLNAVADELQPKCVKYFAEIDAYADAVAKKSGTASQADTIKAQYDASKKSIKTLPAATQDQMCTQGSDALKQARAASGL